MIFCKSQISAKCKILNENKEFKVFSQYKIFDSIIKKMAVAYLFQVLQQHISYAKIYFT